MRIFFLPSDSSSYDGRLPMNGHYVSSCPEEMRLPRVYDTRGRNFPSPTANSSLATCSLVVVCSTIELLR